MSNLSRRSVIKAGVAGGGLLWAAPAIHTAAAHAAPGSPASTVGGVQGQVTDANTGIGISGATVLLDSGESDVTDANGFYTIPAAPAGAHGITASAVGYSGQASAVNIPAGGVVIENFALVLANATSISVVLSWGRFPRDLDLHMSGPDGNGGRFHVNYTNLHPTDFVQQDVDDFIDGNGPETDTVSISATHGNVFVAGDYHIWVHNFSHFAYPEIPDEGHNFTASGGKIVINGHNGQEAQYVVLDATGDPNDDLWRVADFTLDAAGNISLGAVHQNFQPGFDFTVL